jgi:trehalose-6-phosphate hydrolase
MSRFSDKVIYQIYPKSFNDSNGDGVGDLRGIIGRLDYLALLGVDYIWLTPFFTSPQRDNGYDISDYFGIDPLFGDMADLEELVREARLRGIRLMLDMVFNHTSTDHEWFKRALAGEAEYMDYYIFKDGKPERAPTNWISKFGGPAWEYAPSLRKWYLHLFDKTQADLNWENPAVRASLKEVVRFWRDKGIRGFRFDVINLISKPDVFKSDFAGDGRRFYTDGPRVHEYLKELARDAGVGDLLTVGEMSSTTIENCVRYSNPDERELSMCFNFHHLKIDYRDGNKWELAPPDFEALKKLFMDWQIGIQEGGGWNALFWCNHDQPRIVSRLGDAGRYRNQSAKMLASVIHLMRGTPYIFQGEELGMTNAGYSGIDQYRDVESLNYFDIMLKNGKGEDEALAILAARSRDNARTPMQWSAEQYAGFSERAPWISLPANYREINAETEMADENSIFNYYRKLIRLRHERSVVSRGKIEFLNSSCDAILAYRRYTDDDELLVINNFREYSVKSNLKAMDMARYKRLLGNYDDVSADDGVVVLRPYESHIFGLAR